jgi:hypothetical protein
MARTIPKQEGRQYEHDCASFNHRFAFPTASKALVFLITICAKIAHANRAIAFHAG